MTIGAAIALGCFILFMVGGTVVGVFFLLRAWLLSRPDFTTKKGVNVFVDEEILHRVDKSAIDCIISIYHSNMVPPFTNLGLDQHCSGLRCDLRKHSLVSVEREKNPDDEITQANLKKRGERLIGLTHNTRHIEVCCDEDSWDKKTGMIRFEFTALAYEYHNSCIWDLDRDGHMVAYAEKFLSEDNSGHWRWFADFDGDGDVDAQDIQGWKSRRAIYDAQFYKFVKPKIDCKLNPENRNP